MSTWRWRAQATAQMAASEISAAEMEDRVCGRIAIIRQT
jgi:hypothetical protein